MNTFSALINPTQYYDLWLTPSEGFTPFNPLRGGASPIYKVDAIALDTIALTEFAYFKGYSYNYQLEPNRPYRDGNPISQVLSLASVQDWTVFQLNPLPLPLHDTPVATMLHENLKPIADLIAGKGADENLYVVGSHQTVTFYRVGIDYTVTCREVPARLDCDFKAVIPQDLAAWVSCGGGDLIDLALTGIHPDTANKADYLKITSGKHTAKFRLTRWNGDNYAFLVERHIDETTAYKPVATMPYGDFYQAWHYAKAFAASLKDTRPILQNILLLAVGNTALKFIAADGYKLGVYRYESQDFEPFPPMLIPAHDKPLNKLVGKSPFTNKGKRKDFYTTPVVLAYHAERRILRLTYDGKSVDIALGEGKFPDYEGIIPTKKTSTHRLQSADLLQAAEQVAIYARDNADSSTLTFEYGESLATLKLWGKSNEKGELSQMITAHYDGQFTGDGISFNVTYLGCIAGLMDEWVTLSLRGSTDPLLLTSGETKTAVLMPMRLDKPTPPLPAEVKKSVIPVNHFKIVYWDSAFGGGRRYEVRRIHDNQVIPLGILTSPQNAYQALTQYLASDNVVVFYNDHIFTPADGGIITRYHEGLVTNLLSAVEELDALERTNIPNGMVYQPRATPHIKKALQHEKLAVESLATPAILPMSLRKPLVAIAIAHLISIAPMKV